MSRASIRAAVTAFLQPPAVGSLNSVVASRPRNMQGLEWTSGAPGKTDGALGVCFIENQLEQAQTFDGAGGGRLTIYTVRLEVFHRSFEPDAIVAMQQFDAVIDGACNRLRSDPILGLTQAAANAQGLISSAYTQLDVEFGDPEEGEAGNGWINTWGAIRFSVQEWNQVT